jgi:hypothetical protein
LDLGEVLFLLETANQSIHPVLENFPEPKTEQAEKFVSGVSAVSDILNASDWPISGTGFKDKEVLIPPNSARAALRRRDSRLYC